MYPNKNSPKLAKIFECKKCIYKCSKKSDYTKHLSTRKHQILINPNKLVEEIDEKKIICSGCNKEYKHLSTLSAHKKKCINIEDSNIHDPLNDKQTINLLIKENIDFKNIILDLVQNNSNFQKQTLDIQQQNQAMQKQLLDACKNNNSNSNNHINSHNKTFNLQFFLNEQCKDAMNISDFANSIDLQFSDLESVGELGYIEGITKIIVDKLYTMDIYKRPMHCSDAKREILYIKDEDKWAKEPRNNPRLRHAIKTISFKSMKLTNLWSDAYPESKNGDSSLNDKYMKLIKESTGGNGELVDSENKIIRRIAKEIIIEKV